MMREYPGCIVSRWVDGDTVYLLVDLGFHITRLTNVRLARCDAFELRSPGGVEAKAFSMASAPAGTKVTLQSEKVDVYGRSVGEIVLPDGLNLTDMLIANGHALAKTYASVKP